MKGIEITILIKAHVIDIFVNCFLYQKFIIVNIQKILLNQIINGKKDNILIIIILSKNSFQKSILTINSEPKNNINDINSVIHDIIIVIFCKKTIVFSLEIFNFLDIFG